MLDAENKIQKIATDCLKVRRILYFVAASADLVLFM